MILPHFSWPDKLHPTMADDRLLPRHCMALSCQTSQIMAKSRMSPTTWVITSTYQVRGLSFRGSELYFWFLLCVTTPISAWVLHSPAVGGREGVLLLLFLNSQLKTRLCPYQVSKSCIFNPNGVKSSMYVSKIWLPSNHLQSEIRKMFPWKSNKSGWKKLTRKECLLFSEMIRPSSMVSWTQEWWHSVYQTKK